MVLPSGNSHQLMTHARITLKKSGAKGSEKSIQLRVLPDDKTFSFVEIWLPHASRAPGTDRIEVTLTPPGGPASAPLSDAASGQSVELRAASGAVVCKMSYEFMALPTERGRYLIALLPTALHNAPGALAPSGDWTITVRNKTGKKIKNIHAWIQWDDRPLGYPVTGRQAYFVDPAYQRRHLRTGRRIVKDNKKSLIRRAGSFNAIATGKAPIVAGAFNAKELWPAGYSSGGPLTAARETQKPNRAGPDAMAVSEDSHVLTGILAAGSRTGSVFAMNGTSVAAPQIARWLADQLASGKTNGAKQVSRKAKADEKTIFKPLEATLAQPRPPAPERLGKGRMELPKTRIAQTLRRPAMP